jgi:hypothetical protein
MKIATLGTCQCDGFADWLKVLVPGSEVQFYNLNTPAKFEEFAASIRSSDVVFSHPTPYSGPLATRHLAPQCKNFVLVPIVTFFGYQPDMVLLSPALIHPWGGAHSRIVAACFALGLPEARTEKLFNAYIYGRLGYFDEFDISLARLIQTTALRGYEIEPYIDEWTRPGPFMHTINHPAGRVIGRLALMAAQKAGLPVDEDALSRNTIDKLEASFVWPVYPEIAERIGIGGSLTFRPHRRLLPDGQTELSLTECIAGCYKYYRDSNWSKVDLTPIKPAIDIIGEAVHPSCPVTIPSQAA